MKEYTRGYKMVTVTACKALNMEKAIGCQWSKNTADIVDSSVDMK